MTLTETLKFRSNGQALGMMLTPTELFVYFEEIECTPILHTGESFTLHKSDIGDNGKFKEFANYTLDKFHNVFDVQISIR